MFERVVMESLYVVFSFVSFVSAILLVVAFRKEFRKLNLFQTIIIICVFLSSVAPMILGTIQGFLEH